MAMVMAADWLASRPSLSQASHRLEEFNLGKQQLFALKNRIPVKISSRDMSNKIANFHPLG